MTGCQEMKNNLKDYPAILHFMQHKIPIMPVGPERIPLPGWKWKTPEDRKARFTRDLNKINNYMNRFSCFVFYPPDHNIIVLDIDIKHGIDGRDQLQQFIYDNNIILPFPVYNPPVYVTTPSGGRHIYFSYSGPPIKNCHLTNEVEVKYNAVVPVPGSRTRSGEYRLNKTFDYLPLFPYAFRDIIGEKTQGPKYYKNYSFEKKNYSLSDIWDYTTGKAGFPVGGNRNCFALRFASIALYHNHSESDIISHIRDNIPDHDFTTGEIYNTVKSATKGQR